MSDELSPEMPPEPPRAPREWSVKFRDAFRGVEFGMRAQSSFRIHLLVAGCVIIGAVILRLSFDRFCLLLLCITVVLTAEMFNSALESMAQAISKKRDPLIGRALDIASGAVLVGSIGSAIIGILIVFHRFGSLLNWWSD